MLPKEIFQRKDNQGNRQWIKNPWLQAKIICFFHLQFWRPWWTCCCTWWIRCLSHHQPVNLWWTQASPNSGGKLGVYYLWCCTSGWFKVWDRSEVKVFFCINGFFSCTRDERRERIVAAGNSVRQALQDLLNEYLDNAGKVPSKQLDDAIEVMSKKTRDLR